MKNKKIVFLHELKFTDHDIEEIGRDTYAFIATFAYAIDEISVFLKLVIQSHGNKPNDETLLQMFAIQQNTITRVLSAKLVETIKLFGDYERHLKKEGKEKYLNALQPSVEALKLITRSPSFNVSRRLRNKVTNHYLFKDSLQNMDGSVSSNASKSIFLHLSQGNSFAPLGEEVVFLGRFWRYFEEETKLKPNMDRIHEWIDWNQSAAKWAIKTFNAFIIWLHHNEFPEKYGQRTIHYLEPELYGELGINRLPIVFGISDE
ncbi:MAG: hypothetical protein COB08_006810 [Rhodobacteraceae bacterium]|nr:hypothetical protein [Paracoccaceae bacterium]